MVEELTKIITDSGKYTEVASKETKTHIGDDQFVIMTKYWTVLFSKSEDGNDDEEEKEEEGVDEFSLDDFGFNDEKGDVIVGKVTSRKNDDTVRIDCGEGTIEIYHPKFAGKFKKGDTISISIIKGLEQ